MLPGVAASDCDLYDLAGLAPLRIAAGYGRNAAIVEFLPRSNADPAIRDGAGRLPVERVDRSAKLRSSDACRKPADSGFRFLSPASGLR